MTVFHVSLLYLQDSTQDGTLGGLPLCISPQKLRISSVRKSHRTLKIYHCSIPGAVENNPRGFWRRELRVEKCAPTHACRARLTYVQAVATEDRVLRGRTSSADAG